MNRESRGKEPQKDIPLSERLDRHWSISAQLSGEVKRKLDALAFELYPFDSEAFHIAKERGILNRHGTPTDNGYWGLLKLYEERQKRGESE